MKDPAIKNVPQISDSDGLNQPTIEKFLEFRKQDDF